MALPGLLIEYLVVGSMALLWLLPLAGINFNGNIPFGKAAALAPAIYVLGMFIDCIAFILVSKLPQKRYSLKTMVRYFVKKKSDIKKIEQNVFKEGSGRSSRGMIWLYLNAPDLVKEVEARSSRDRVARGAFINVIFMWIVFSVYTIDGVDLLRSFNHFEWFLLMLFSLVVWLFLEANSFGFELRTGEMVAESDKFSGDTDTL